MLVKRVAPRRFFYANNINMGMSFDSLAMLANRLLGAEIETGDILICDNKKKDKRKMLQKTPQGWMIYYGRLDDKTRFSSLQYNNGPLLQQPKRVL